MYQKATSITPRLTPATQAFLNELGKQDSAPLYTLSPTEARAVLRAVQTPSPLPERLDCLVHDDQFPVGPYESTDVRFYRPYNKQNNLPVLVYFHGGGWVMGDKDTHDRLMRTLCVGAGITVLFIDYKPAPESQYPNLIEENYAALEYISAHAADYLINPKKLAVGGDSAGGNIATVCALLSKERKGPAIKKQFLFYPVTDAGMNSPSYTDFENGPWLTKKAMAYFWDAYAPDLSERQNIYVSPINASIEELRHMPPAFIITAQNDVLRDEGEAYANKLMQAGNEVTAVRYLGTIHDFMVLNGLANSAPTRAACRQVIHVLKETFRR